jgi:hypothetical protein
MMMCTNFTDQNQMISIEQSSITESIRDDIIRLFRQARKSLKDLYDYLKNLYRENENLFDR